MQMGIKAKIAMGVGALTFAGPLLISTSFAMIGATMRGVVGLPFPIGPLVIVVGGYATARNFGYL